MGVDAPNLPPTAPGPDGGGSGGDGAPPVDPETLRRQRRSNRIPLVIVLLLTLVGVAAVVYDTVAPTTEEPLDASSHTAVVQSCDGAFHTLKALPPLTKTTTRTELAARTTQENAVFATMVGGFARVQPTDRDGRIALRALTSDWNAVLKRRAQYVHDLGTTNAHVDLVIPIDDKGAPVTDRMNQYARTHELEQCLTQNLQLETVDTIRQYPANELDSRLMETVGG